MHTSTPLVVTKKTKNVLICVLLLLAATHCVQSIFMVNMSLIDLKAYAQGQAKNPFQERVAMMPVVQWAGQSSLCKKAADFVQLRIFKGRNKPAEPFSPEKIACMAVGLIATYLATSLAIFFGTRATPKVWWLPASLFIFMLYVTYAARSENQYWYPYDLPHFALFGIAAVCVLQGWWAVCFCLFVVDLPVRETAIYLVPLILAVGIARRQKQVVLWVIPMMVLWLAARILISHRFAGNPSDTRIHWDLWIHTVKEPWVWPQLASAFGYLLIPFYFGFNLLTREERFFVYGALPGIFITLLYGVWYETRIYDEWLLPAAVLMSLQIYRIFVVPHKSAQTTDALYS